MSAGDKAKNAGQNGTGKARKAALDQVRWT